MLRSEVEGMIQEDARIEERDVRIECVLKTERDI